MITLEAAGDLLAAGQRVRYYAVDAADLQPRHLAAPPQGVRRPRGALDQRPGHRRRHGHGEVTVDLRSGGCGLVTVKFTVKRHDAKRLTLTHEYHTCTPGA